ncbi:hypothetical protein AVEN_206637-1 [Araneus ventricosus]|uniref:Uncharacterized protein n=1 Tax=Araneus ventricosus TaxID=182803 RepID=A0A4Y2KL01_ARAVE|nr:hypothetical protein AVEN_206637-1 [Araneus ventricosus]
MRLPGRQSLKRGAVLQTWEVASHQCKSYGWEKSFDKVKHGVTSATVIAPLTLATNLATILAIWRPWRQIDDSRKCNPFIDISTRKVNTRENTM